MLLWNFSFWSWCQHVMLMIHWYIQAHSYLHISTQRFSSIVEAHPIIMLGGVSRQKSQHVFHLLSMWLKIAIIFKIPRKTSLKAVQCPFRKITLFCRVFGVGVRSMSASINQEAIHFPESVLLLSINCFCFTEFVSGGSLGLSPQLKRLSAYGSNCGVEGQIFSSVISRNWAYTSLEHSPFGLNRNL